MINFLLSDLTSNEPNNVVDVTLAVRRQKRSSSGPDVKLILQVVLALTFVFSLFMLDSASNAEMASLTLYLADQKRVFVGQVVPNMTVLDAVNAAALAGNIRFQFAIEGDKTKIINFAGLSTATIADSYLIFLNEQRLDASEINKIPIHSRDEVILRISASHKK